MGKAYKDHHFLPRFYIDYWQDLNGLVTIYLKEDPDKKYKNIGKNIGFKKHLYTMSNGRVDIEVRFFGEVDGKADNILKKIAAQENYIFDKNSKEDLALFINTLHSRHPEFVSSLRNFNEQQRILGLNQAEETYQETGEDLRGFYVKRDYCDSPYLIEYFARGDDYNRIVNACWKVVEVNSNDGFITSDFPLSITSLDGVDNGGVELPNRFYMTLPLSPKKALIISTEEGLIHFLTRDLNTFVSLVNAAVIANADKIIIDKDDDNSDFIRTSLIH